MIQHREWLNVGSFVARISLSTSRFLPEDLSNMIVVAPVAKH